MEFLMETTSNFKFENKIVNACYNNIRKNYISMQKSVFTIAANFYKLSEQPEDLREEGFSDIVDFGKKILNVEKSQTYAFVTIGRRFTTDGKCKLGDGYNMTQLQALLPIKNDNVIMEWVQSGKLNSDMSVREIKNMVKKQLGKNVIDGEAKEIEDNKNVIDGEAKEIEDNKNVQVSEQSENNKKMHEEKGEQEQPDDTEIDNEVVYINNEIEKSEKYDEMNIDIYKDENGEYKLLLCPFGSVEYTSCTFEDAIEILKSYMGE